MYVKNGLLATLHIADIVCRQHCDKAIIDR